MKRIKALRLTAIFMALLTVCVCFGACSGSSGNTPGTDPTEVSAQNTEGEELPVITASPDGEVTASPTREPASSADPDSGTEAPVITASPDGAITASPTQAPDASGEPGTTGAPGPGTTIEPINDPSDGPAPIMTNLPRPTGVNVTPTPRPGVTPSPSAAPTTDPYNSPTCPPINGYEVHYAGAVVDCTGLKAGDTFYWTFDLVNEHSRMWSGHWLIDYNERYLRVDSYSTSWSGGISYQVTQTWDDENPSSDKPAIVCNPEYMGQTGGKPLGVADNLYANAGMYLTSFEFYGLQASGSLIRFKFEVKERPSNSAMKHDSNGYYLEIPILIYESTATIDNPIAPGSYSSEDHGIVTCDPGRLYFAN